MSERPMSIHDIWKESGFDIVVPTSEELIEKDARLRSSVSRSNLLEYVAGLLLFGVSSYFAAQAASGVALAGWVLTMVATVFIMTNLYFRSKGDGPVFGDDTTAHYLASLIRRRDLLGSIWKWYILPLVPGFALLRIAMHGLVSPDQQMFHYGYDVAALILALALALWNHRKAKELNAEIVAIRHLQSL
ncbi:hypothetical protein [Erythrobacter sp.]|uniref:hypothetical protein n=1 Tax=Erythrobacter sp. TaxID=1042 RepID=UPI00311DB74E